MGNRKKVLAFAAVIFMLLSAIPITLSEITSEDSSASCAVSSIPSKYDLRETYKNVTSVKNQGSEGLCWAFSTTAALEGEMINLGYDVDSLALSPLFEGVMEFDSTTYSGHGDSNVILSGELNTSGASLLQIGLLYSSSKGPIYEYMAPYTEFTPNYCIDRTLSESPLIIVKGIQLYDPYTQMDEIKKMIMEGHIGVMGYHATGGTSESDNIDKYESIYPNHGVALVGWDDDYSKDNFSVKPENNGAWLIKNSWGVDVGDAGYRHISYETEIQCVLFFTDVELNDGTQHMYSYDNGYSQYHDMICTGSAKMCNVFTAERDETLTGASFSIYREYTTVDQDYTVNVYKLRSGYSSPTDGKLIASSDKANICGLGTEYIEFNDGIKLTKGETFSICINFTGEVIDIPIDTTETYLSAYKSYTVASPGQSYVYYNGHWTDISSDNTSNVRIKAYTSTETAYEAVLNGTSYEKLSEALDASKNGETVYLLRDVDCGQFNISKNITLDLRGFDLTVRKTDDSKAAITADDCDLKLKYGSIITDGTVLSTSNGSLDIYRLLIKESGNGFAIVTKNTEVNIDALTYTGGDLVDATEGSLSISDSYITCTGIAVRSSGCSALILSGSYGSDTASLSGDVKVISGTSKFDPTPFVHPTSSVSYSSDGVYKITAAEVEEHNGYYTLNDAVEHTDGSVIKLTRDTVLDTPIQLQSTGPVTIDLNGYDITCSKEFKGALFTLMDALILTNSSSNVSSIDTTILYDGSISSEPKISIGSNIEVTVSSAIASNKADVDLSISDGSKVTRTVIDGYEKTVVQYIVSENKVKELHTITVTDAYGNIDAIYSGYKTQIGFIDYSFKNGKVYDEGGKEIGTWERDYSLNSADHSMTTVDRIEYADGTKEVDYQSKYHDNGTTVLYLVQTKAVTGKECELICTMYGESHTYNVDYSMMKKCTENIKKAEENIKDIGCSSVKKVIRIESMMSDNKLLVKDEVNEYLSHGYDVQINHAEFMIELKSGTGLLTGDTLMTFEKAGHSTLTSAQTASIGSGTAYLFTATVNGQNVELPCKCTLCLSCAQSSDNVYCSVDSEGKLTELRSAYDGSSCSYMIEIDSACILVQNANAYSDGSNDSALYVTIAAVGILALGIMTIGLVRKP